MPRPKGDLQLAIGYWIVSHKPTLKKWWALILMAFIGGSFLWTVVFFVFFFRGQAAMDDQLAQAAGRLGRLTLGIHRPADLVPGDVTILTRDRGHIDLVAKVQNPNTDWGAVKVVYHWQIGETNSSPETAFINANTTRAFITLNSAVSQIPASATIVLDEVEWTRVGGASFPAPIFTTDTVTLTPTTITVGGQSVATVNINATVTNKSVYNFFRVVVPVLILSGDRVVAADVVNLERWPTLTSRTIATSWSYPVSGATRAEIEPQVSQFELTNIYR